MRPVHRQERPVRAQSDLLLPAPDPLDPAQWRSSGDVGAPGGDDAVGAVRKPARRSRKSGTSPTARSLARLRADGWLAEVVERWNPHARVRNDLFGFIDVLAIRGGEVLGVQATSRDNVAARVAKIGDHANVGAVRKAGIRLEVHGWGKMASGRWELRCVDVS